MTEPSQESLPEQQQAQKKKREGDYPVSESYKILEGYDIYRSSNLIVALVAVESQFGKDLRLYRWQKRKDQWKVDLCRMSVASWNWDVISSKAKELTEKYGLGRKNRSSNKSGEEEQRQEG
jgi:hypothetical protein